MPTKPNLSVSQNPTNFDILLKINSLEDKVTHIDERVFERLETMEKGISQLVTRYEFMPVKMIVYGMVALMLSGMAGALVSMVLIK